MAATRENVLAAITLYVEDNKRRAPALAIASIVGDDVKTVKGIIKALVTEGVLESSRGRNGGAKPVQAASEAGEVVQNDAADADASDDVASQFAAMLQELEAHGDDAAAVG